MDQAFADAGAMGVTVTAAAGDAGSSDTPVGLGRPCTSTSRPPAPCFWPAAARASRRIRSAAR